MSNLKEFRGKLLHSKKHEKHIPRSITKREFYFDYLKIKPKYKKYIISESMHIKILNAFFSKIGERLLHGDYIRMPYTFGGISIRMRPVSVEFVDGQLRTSRPVQWGKTIKLWVEDPQAYQDKLVVRSEDDYVYTLIYSKYRAFFKNVKLIKLQTNRNFKEKMRVRIGTKDFQCFKTNAYGK